MAVIKGNRGVICMTCIPASQQLAVILTS